jgi:hypothetical protein
MLRFASYQIKISFHKSVKKNTKKPDSQGRNSPIFKNYS